MYTGLKDMFSVWTCVGLASKYDCEITFASFCPCLIQAELEAARKFLYHEMGYRSRSEQLTKTSEINLDYQEVVR